MCFQLDDEYVDANLIVSHEYHELSATFVDHMAGLPSWLVECAHRGVPGRGLINVQVINSWIEWQNF